MGVTLEEWGTDSVPKKDDERSYKKQTKYFLVNPIPLLEASAAIWLVVDWHPSIFEGRNKKLETIDFMTKENGSLNPKHNTHLNNNKVPNTVHLHVCLEGNQTL